MQGSEVRSEQVIEKGADSKQLDNESLPGFISEPPPTRYPIIKGILIPQFGNNLFVKTGILNVSIGNAVIPIPASNFLHGFNVFDYYSRDISSDCTRKKLFLGVRNNRLYISVEFKDLQADETIGTIVYNHWNLKNDKVDYESTDQKLEVRDLQHNVVMSIAYKDRVDKQGQVSINCYLLDPWGVVVLNDGTTGGGKLRETFSTMCFSRDQTDWKNQAVKEIVKIHSIFQKQDL